WGSMTRKPGQPAEYMGTIYAQVLNDLRMAPSPAEKYPETLSERIWEAIIKKLQQKDYKFDPAFFGTLTEYSQKIAYFFHASLQGTACYAGAARALEQVHGAGLRQGLNADAQCFSFVQLKRGLAEQHCGAAVDILLEKPLCALSSEVGGQKPS